MKIIFLRDLPNVAQAGDIKEVADGYARNFLIPKGFAMVAKPGTANLIAARKAKIAAESNEVADKLEGLEISLKARAGAQDRLYGAITAADIASALTESLLPLRSGDPGPGCVHAPSAAEALSIPAGPTSTRTATPNITLTYTATPTPTMTPTRSPNCSRMISSSAVL